MDDALVPRGLLGFGTRAALAILLFCPGCGNATGPDEPEEYAFVLSAPAGVEVEAEVVAYARVDGNLREVNALFHLTLDGSDRVWSATEMIRATLEDEIDVDPPNPGTGPPPPSSPVEVTVGDKTARVLGMKVAFLNKLGGQGTVTLRGTVNGETKVSDSITGPTGSIGPLTLGDVP